MLYAWTRLMVVIISACCHSGSCAAIPPFKELKNRKTVFLWQNKSPKLTYAFWAMVLGPDAVSDDAKVNVGQGALYITNGFK